MDERGLSPSRAVDAACDRFEAHWRRGEEPDLAAHLAEAPHDERDALLLELVLVDAAWRRRRGDRVSLEYYIERFPALDAAAAGRELGPGRTGSRFELLERLGSGAFGTTWRARDATLGRDVAVKVARSDEGEQSERFARETRAAARLRHPGIAIVHEATEIDGRATLVTELVAGPSLAAHVSSGWRPSPREAAALVASVAEALQHAHELGIVHRDVKPGNIVVESATGRPVLVDFGLASDTQSATLTADGHVLGTPAYMSPEQARGDSRWADERTDVHSCGAVLYELLTGAPPFPPGPGLLQRVADEEPVPPRRLAPAIPRDLETIVLKAMAKQRGARYATAAALAQDLRRWIDGRPIVARPPSPLGRAARWARRQPALAASALVVVALLATLALVMVRAARDVAVQRDEALALLDRVREAERGRDEQTFESRLAEAEALVSSSRSGRRFGALAAVDAAAALLPGLPPRGDRMRRLRTVLLSALCLSDMRPTATYPLPPDTPAFAFSRDLSAWARADALGAISVRDASDAEILTLPGLDGPVERLEFSLDGDRLAATHGGKAPPLLVVWDWRAARPVARLQPAPPSVAWAPDERGLYVELAGRSIGRLDLEDGTLAPVAGVSGRLLAAGPGDRLLLTDGDDLRRIHVASALTGALLARMQAPEDAWVGALDPVDGGRALVSSGRDLVLLDVSSGRTLATLEGHHTAVTIVCFSPDGRWGASHGWDGITHAWDLERGRSLAAALNALPGFPVLAFGEDSRTLLSHSDGTRTGPFDLALELPVVELDLKRLLGHAPGLVSLSDDGRMMLAWAEPGRVGKAAALLDLDTARRVAVLPDAGTESAAFLPNGAGLVTSSPAGLRVWPLPTDAGVGAARVVVAQPMRELAITPDGTRFAGVLSRSREVIVGRLDDGSVSSRFLPSHAIFTLGVDAEARRVALGNWHGRVATCHDAHDGRVLFETVAKSSVLVDFSPVDGSLLTHGGDDLRLLDPQTGAVRAALLLGGGADAPVRVAFAKRARIMAILDPRKRGALRLLDAVSLEDLAGIALPALESEAFAWCAIDAAGARLCAGTVSGRLFVWDLTALRAELRAKGLDW